VTASWVKEHTPFTDVPLYPELITMWLVTSNEQTLIQNQDY